MCLHTPVSHLTSSLFFQYLMSLRKPHIVYYFTPANSCSINWIAIEVPFVKLKQNIRSGHSHNNLFISFSNNIRDRHLSPHFTVGTSSTKPSLITPSNAMVKPSFASLKRFLNSPWGPTIVQTFCMYGTYQYIERYVFKSLYSFCSFLSFLFSNQSRLYHHLN